VFSSAAACSCGETTNSTHVKSHYIIGPGTMEGRIQAGTPSQVGGLSDERHFSYVLGRHQKRGLIENFRIRFALLSYAASQRLMIRESALRCNARIKTEERWPKL